MNKIIINNNKFARLSTLDNGVLNSVRKLLSYTAIGVEYSAAFKNGWDGVTYLMNNKGNFHLGLLNKVEDFFKSKNIRYELEDSRKVNTFNKPIDIYNRLKLLGLVPRDYQEDIVNIATKHNRGIVRACTGSGKSVCMAMLTARLNEATNIYVIGLDLLQQMHDLFSSIFDEPIGFIGDGRCEIERINIVSIWSIGSALNIKQKFLFKEDDSATKEKILDLSHKNNIINLLQKTKTHIFDESHIITTSTIKNIYNHIDPKFIYGFSGTPFRDDNTDLLIHGILGEQIVDLPASILIEKKVLAQPIIKFINIPKMPIYGKTYAEVYAEYIVNNETRNLIIVDETKKLLNKNYQVLILFKQISHGKILFSLLEDNNIYCEMLTGSAPLEKRNEVKDKLLTNKLQVVLASTIFDIGVDIASISGLILSGSGKSSIRALQRIGRVIRKYPNKNYAAIVDFVDNCRFLKQHSEARHKIYTSEKGFIVKYPTQKYM